MLLDSVSQITSLIKNALDDKRHSFRYGNLATVGSDLAPRVRTVMVRNIDPKATLSFYGDGRALKMQHISQNPKVSLSLYDPAEMIQFRFDGTAKICTDPKRTQETWAHVPPILQRDYTTHKAPGAILDSDGLDYLVNENFFTIVDIIPRQIECMVLGKNGHQKTLFVTDGFEWSKKALVP